MNRAPAAFKRTSLRILLAVLGTGVEARFPQHAMASDCDRRITVSQTGRNAVSVTDQRHTLRTLPPSFFGFNIEWVDFQQDLWDSSRSVVRGEIVHWMQAFAGAVYRYPGGTGANHLDWRDSVGDQSARPSRKRVDWLGAIRAEFGFAEYLDFVKAVAGEAWIVLNIFGSYEGEGDPRLLAGNAAAWASHANRQSLAGQPAVLRWELGNELDRGRTLWSAERYAAAASLTARTVSEGVPHSRFVAMLQDWPAQREVTVSQYNRRVIKETSQVTREFAHHLYYEETPGDSVEQRLSLVCRSRDDARASGVNDPVFWITEHARGLPGPVGDEHWKASWPKTANLEAGLIAAEAYVTASQIPEVRGLFLHSLGTTHGPWPLFNSRRSGQLHPSAVYWSLFVLRTTMLPLVVPVRIESTRENGEPGRHSVRAVLMTDASRTRFTLWAVNRSATEAPLQIIIPSLAGRPVTGDVISVNDLNKEANNYAAADRVRPTKYHLDLQFSSSGAASIVLPGYSVSGLQLTPR